MGGLFMIKLVQGLWTMALVILLFCAGMLVADRVALFEDVVVLEIAGDPVVVLHKGSKILQELQHIVERSGFENGIEAENCIAWMDAGSVLPAGRYHVIRFLTEDEENIGRFLLCQNDEVQIEPVHSWFLSCVGYREKLFVS